MDSHVINDDLIPRAQALIAKVSETLNADAMAGGVHHVNYAFVVPRLKFLKARIRPTDQTHRKRLT
jgi:hypothetical protein